MFGGVVAIWNFRGGGKPTEERKCDMWIVGAGKAGAKLNQSGERQNLKARGCDGSRVGDSDNMEGKLDRCRGRGCEVGNREQVYIATATEWLIGRGVVVRRSL